MNLYAIRDRLIDYFQQPFVGPDDKNVLASVARLINQGEITSDIAQAPHHFEVWQIAEIKPDGHIEAKRELICDCSSLVRPGIRQGGHPRNPAPEDQPGQGTRPAGGNAAHGAPKPGPLPNASPATPGAADEVLQGPRGGYPPRNGI